MQRLAELTDTFGNRMTCSDRLENAIDHLMGKASEEGMDNVHKEPVTDLPNWQRGQETATLLGWAERVYRKIFLWVILFSLTPTDC